MKDSQIQKTAMEYAKKNGGHILARHFPVYPLSIFMAGSPGAGKTEVAKEIAAQLTTSDSGVFWHIDPDNFRDEFPDYSDETADSYQEAIRYLAEWAMRGALDAKRGFVMDGTFSDIVRQRKYIKLSAGAKRRIIIVYVHQLPQVAWAFVRKRQKAEGRRVPPEVFVRSYLGARAAVSGIKKEFGDAVRLDLVVKDSEDVKQIKLHKKNIASLDLWLPREYNKRVLTKIVSEQGDDET